ncbi:MAG: hypothetical protein HXK85_08015 [Lachnospiraceae bacterium]|nr:hypothetical protein [Lachnospiraceae bacterium]MBF1023008.1 hypothetical protein [Lachnospiraceae bacterium]
METVHFRKGSSDMTESYLEMMLRSLDRKIEILNRIEQENRKQRDLLDFPVQEKEAEEVFEEEAFQRTVEEKGRLIEELLKLNEGFDLLFAKVQKELSGQWDDYRSQVRTMQEKIRMVTELSSRIQVQEQRNKALVDRYFSEERTKIKIGKRSTASAMKYYQTMNKTQHVGPQMFDENR